MVTTSKYMVRPPQKKGEAERRGVKPDDVDSEALEDGTKEEAKEHGLPKKKARKIALDHLAKDPDAYKSEALFEAARDAILSGDDEAASAYKRVLTERAFMARVTKAMGAIAGEPVEKAILTKTSEQKEAKPKGHQPTKAKVKVGPKGKKRYDYGKDKKGPKKPSAAPPAQSPSQAAPQAKDAMPDQIREVDPSKLSDLLSIPLETLKKFAAKHDADSFRRYFKGRCGPLVKKHKIPDVYFEEVHRVLTREPRPKMTVAKSERFTLHPEVYRRDSELRRTTAAMLKAGVTDARKLGKFLLAQFELSVGEAEQTARQMMKALAADGALKKGERT